MPASNGGGAGFTGSGAAATALLFCASTVSNDLSISVVVDLSRERPLFFALLRRWLRFLLRRGDDDRDEDDDDEDDSEDE